MPLLTIHGEPGDVARLPGPTRTRRPQAKIQREVDELTRQKDSTASHLAQVRQLLGGQLAGTDAVQAAQTKPAVAGDPGPADGARGNGSGAAPAAPRAYSAHSDTIRQVLARRSNRSPRPTPGAGSPEPPDTIT